MTPEQRTAVAGIVTACYELYGRPVTPGLLDLFVSALDHYDPGDIRRALNEHVRNPDNGQFPPKPGDIVRALEGSTETQGMQAWSDVEAAVRYVGPYQSITFDDPVVMRTIEDMGGWIKLCEITDDDLPFRAKEFVTRYRGYASRNTPPEHSARLMGIHEANNVSHGLPAPEVKRITSRGQSRFGIGHQSQVGHSVEADQKDEHGLKNIKSLLPKRKNDENLAR